jgi:phosphoribosylanthranilate isomerase
VSPAVKICGLKTHEAIDAALDAGADLLGFVIYPKSPRHVSVEDAAALVAYARGRGPAAMVTLLVDPDDELVDRVVAEVGPDVIQLHGHETVARVQEVRARSDLSILKAVPVAAREDVSAALEYLVPYGMVMLLFDAKPPDDPRALPGGNGLAFDWRILDVAQERGPWVLAGGLTPDNVAQAVSLTHAAIVDVSSGVESGPGQKDPELIRRFLRAAKAANEAGDT